jgi:hypothetical protein
MLYEEKTAEIAESAENHLSRSGPPFRIGHQEGRMLKKVLSVMLAATIVSQGAARADEAAAREVSVVRDRAALAAHIDGLAEGDLVAIATDEGIVSGEVVDKDADDVIVDQPLVQGGVERVVIPRHGIQGVQYQQTPKGHLTVQDRILIVAVVVVGAFFVWAKGAGLGGP